MTEDNLDVKRFINDTRFSLADVDHQYPNARCSLTGSLFISHSGMDFRRLLDDVVKPIRDRFADGYFLHNRKSGGSHGYKELVRAALHWCDKFMVVISQHSLSNGWVHAEVDWAVNNSRPIVCCMLDSSDPEKLHPSLARSTSKRLRKRGLYFVDFQREKEHAQAGLATILDELLIQRPYPRFPNGRPGWSKV